MYHERTVRNIPHSNQTKQKTSKPLVTCAFNDIISLTYITAYTEEAKSAKSRLGTESMQASSPNHDRKTVLQDCCLVLVFFFKSTVLILQDS